MNVSDAAGRREVRVAAMVLTSLGWLVLVAGIAANEGAMVLAGAVVGAVSNVIVLKLLLESRSATGSLRERVDRLRHDLESCTRTTVDVARRVEESSEQLRAALSDVASRVARVEHDLDASRTAIAASERESRLALEAIGMTRSIVDKLAAQVPTALARRLPSVSLSNVDEPLLSIAVPSYNRPALLAECLASIEREIRNGFEGVVEVCITDDASADPETLQIAVEFAERCPFASVQRQPVNVGIDRNIIAACQPCRGEFLLILGNDDRMVEGALATIVADLRRVDAAVLLYDKIRIAVDGRPREQIPGSKPIEVAPGDSHRFATLLDAARQQGFLSSFGFISQVVFRRAPFLAVDPAPYFDLTMYTQVFVLVEAFARTPVFYRNEPIVYHRTASPDHKRVEAIGRREADFMSGGQARGVRYFGTTLAAAWQRLLDRTGLDPAFLREQPETLLTAMSLVRWIEANRAAGSDAALEPGIVADADRFMAAVGLEPTR